MKSRRLIRIYCLFQLFFGLLIWAPIFYEYQKRVGISDHEIFSVQGIYYLFFCVLEIPTGWMADRLGYLLCLRWGAILTAFTQLLPIYFPNFYGFIAHFLLIALSRSLISGASSAYLFEYLKEQGESSRYREVEGIARGYNLVAKVLTWSWVGWLMDWHLTWPYWITFIATSISIVFVMQLPDVKPTEGRSTGGLNEMKKVFDHLRVTPGLFLVMVQGVMIFVLSRLVQLNLFQPILGEKGWSVKAYGMVMAAMTVFEAIGSFKLAWITRRLNHKDAVMILGIAMAFTVGLIPVSSKWVTVLMLCLFSWTVGLVFPIQKQLVNEAITHSKYRATLLSFESILDRGVCSAVAWALGFYLSAHRMNYFLIQGALLTAACTWFASRRLRTVR